MNRYIGGSGGTLGMKTPCTALKAVCAVWQLRNAADFAVDHQRVPHSATLFSPAPTICQFGYADAALAPDHVCRHPQSLDSRKTLASELLGGKRTGTYWDMKITRQWQLGVMLLSHFLQSCGRVLTAFVRTACCSLCANEEDGHIQKLAAWTASPPGS